MSTTSTTISREIDIFESQGGGDSNTVSYEDDRNSKAVESIESGFQGSFSKFKKKQLRPYNADFSDSVSRPVEYGFKTELNEYELEGTPSNETIMQKYQRLKIEVSALVSEVDQLKNSESEELSSVNPADVISDLQQLQSTLNQLELDRVLTDSSVLTGNENAPQSVLVKELQMQVAAAKAPIDDTKPSEGAVYEVYGNVEAAKFGHLSKLSELEKRLTTLEDVVGKTNTKGSVVAAELDADYKDLSSAVLGIQSRVALLDEAHVMSITGQLNELLTVINKLGGDNKTKEDTEHKTKVSEALETISSISPLISVVPDVVNRLHTLKDLHEHAAQLVTTIATMSGEQDKITEQLSVLKSILEQVSSSVSDNVATLASNYEALESRIKGLSK